MSRANSGGGCDCHVHFAGEVRAEVQFTQRFQQSSQACVVCAASMHKVVFVEMKIQSFMRIVLLAELKVIVPQK